jgi:hypothetical protein
MTGQAVKLQNVLGTKYEVDLYKKADEIADKGKGLS